MVYLRDDELMKLTQKQENFTLNLFKGMSQRLAYVAAGYSSEQSDASLDVRACELAKDSKVLVRLEELRQVPLSEAISTVTERLERVTTIERESAEDCLKAIDLHNKMDKVYEEKTPGTTVINSFTFVLPNGDRVTPKELKEVIDV